MIKPLYSTASPDPRLAGYLSDFPEDLFTPQLFRSVALAQGYARAHALALLGDLALVDLLGDWCSAHELLQRRGFVAGFYHPLVWVLETAVEAGALAAEGEAGDRRYRLLDASAPAFGSSQLPALRSTALENDASIGATLDLLDTAAAAHAAVAAGRLRGEDALFGMGQLDLWQRYFNNHNRLYAVNNRVSATAAALRLAESTPNGPLRVLEIGAGTGSGTEALLHALALHGLSDRIGQYIVSEPNAFFRRRAERMLRAAYPNLPLKFQSLDIDKPWTEALPEGSRFDLIFGVNVMHVANDLRFSLDEARDHLADDGWLVAGECLRPFPHQPIYAELMFQILDSYVGVQTDAEIRPNPGFLTPELWTAALAAAGYQRIEIVPDPVRIREIYNWFFVGALCAQGTARTDPGDAVAR